MFDSQFPFETETKSINKVDTCVYDMRRCSGQFVKGESLKHNFDINLLKQNLQTKFHTEDKNIIVDNHDSLSVCFILDNDQLSEIQILMSSPLAFEESYSDISGEVTRGVSVILDMDVTELLNSYNVKAETSMDSVCIMKGSLVIKEGSFRDHNIVTFDSVRLFQDCPFELRIVHFIDWKHEMLLYLRCFKSDNIGKVKNNLKQEFPAIFGHVEDQGHDVWISSGTTVLQDADYIFLDDYSVSNTSDTRQLTVHICERGSVALSFRFQNETKMIPISIALTLQDFRKAVSRVIHRPANSLKILYRGKKVDDKTIISQLLLHSKKHDLHVELATEKIYRFDVVNVACPSMEKRCIDVKAYKLDTLADLKRQAAVCLGVEPFHLQLVQHGTQLDEYVTLQTSKIRSGDNLQVIIFPLRVRICLKQSKGERLYIIVDEPNKTTISDMTEFCGQRWETDTSNINIIFRASLLTDKAMTLSSAGVVSGSVLVACGFTETNEVYLQNVIRMFRACSDGLFEQIRAIKMYGRVIPVPENMMFDEPLGSSLPPIDNRRLKGLHIDTKQTQQDRNSRLNIGNTIVPNKVSQHQCNSSQTNVSDATESCTTKTTCIFTSTSSASPSAVVVSDKTVTTQSPKGSGFYIGDDLSSTSDLLHIMNIQHEIRSPDGKLVGVESTRSAFVAPVGIGTHRSLSDSTLVSVPTAKPLPLSKSFCLPEPRNAVPERVLNWLADELGNSWFSLGLRLGMKYSDMEQIKHDQHNDLKGQALCMLHRWKKQNGGRATVTSLCETLRLCNLGIHAESIEAGGPWETAS